MALTPAQQSSKLFKKSLGAGETLTTRQFFEEPKLGRDNIIPTQIWAQADQIPATAPVLSDGQITGVTQYFSKLLLSFVPGSVSGASDASYYHSGLTDAIPFNYDPVGSYFYTLYKNDGTTVIAFGVGDWLVDTSAGLLTFYGTVPAGVTSATPPRISFYKYIGSKGLTSSGSTTGISSLSTALSVEVSGRTSGDTSLSTSISTLSTSVSTSVSFLISTDTVLSLAITDETSRAISVEGTKLSLSGGTMTGSIDMTGHQIIVNVDPVSQYDLANKGYVDAIAQGLAIHAPVHVVSTSPILLTGGTALIDGHLVIEGEFVLVASQVDAKYNGIYVVHSASTWTRRLDADGLPANEIELGDFTFVQSGVTYKSTGWAIGSSNATGATITPNVDTQDWFLMSSPGTYTADGEGIQLNSGTTFVLELNGNTLSKDAFGLKVSDSLSTTISTDTLNITNLQSSVSTNTSDIVVISGVTASLSTAISYNASVINVLSGATSSLSSAISTTNSTLSTNVSTLISTDSSLSTSITGITSNITSLSTNVSDQISQLVSTDIILSTILTGVTSNITSISTAIVTLTSTDSSLSTALTGVTSSTTSLSTAVIGLVSTDQSLSMAITGLTGNINSLSTAIFNEASTRLSVDQSLSTLLVASNSGISSLSVALSIVISGNTYDDSSLSTAIKNEISDRTVVDQSLSSAITGLTSITSSMSVVISTEISNRTSADTSIMTVINNLSGVTAETAGSGLTYNSTEKSLNVNVDGWTIKIISDQLVGSRQWIQPTTTANVTGSTSGYTGLALTFNPITPVTAYVNGIEYLVNPHTYPSINYPFFYNQYPPVLGTQIWFDPITAEFDLVSGVDMVTIKYLIVEV